MQWGHAGRTTGVDATARDDGHGPRGTGANRAAASLRALTPDESKGPRVALSADEVRHVASLARLALDDEEVERLAPQLSQILDYAEQIGEVAADDVPASTHPFPLANVLRADERRASLAREDVLAGAPEVEEDRFAVPRIVSEEG